MSNKVDGNKFEREFCELLAEDGFWVHRLKEHSYGQPADVIAVRNGGAYLIDCKVCAKNTFNLSRIEPNQETAMELWSECGNGDGWFAVKINDEIYMIAKHTLDWDVECNRLTEEDLAEYGMTLKRWLEKC